MEAKLERVIRYLRVEHELAIRDKDVEYADFVAAQLEVWMTALNKILT